MDPRLNLQIRQNTAKRAHIYGAEALILERQADAISPGPLPPTIDDCTDDQLRALLLAKQANEARRRYFRELASVDTLAGIPDSPFGRLG